MLCLFVIRHWFREWNVRKSDGGGVRKIRFICLIRLFVFQQSTELFFFSFFLLVLRFNYLDFSYLLEIINLSFWCSRLFPAWWQFAQFLTQLYRTNHIIWSLAIVDWLIGCRLSLLRCSFKYICFERRFDLCNGTMATWILQFEFFAFYWRRLLLRWYLQEKSYFQFSKKVNLWQWLISASFCTLLRTIFFRRPKNQMNNAEREKNVENNFYTCCVTVAVFAAFVLFVFRCVFKPAYVCSNEAGLLCARECDIWMPMRLANGLMTGVFDAAELLPVVDAPVVLPLLFGEQMVVVPEPNAESTEFSRVCETDGDFEPVDGGLKKESGKFRMRNGTCNGRAFWFSATSNRACKLSSEFSSIRTTRLSLAACAAAAALAFVPPLPIAEFSVSLFALLTAPLFTFAADAFELFAALLMLFKAILCRLFSLLFSWFVFVWCRKKKDRFIYDDLRNTIDIDRVFVVARCLFLASTKKSGQLQVCKAVVWARSVYISIYDRNIRLDNWCSESLASHFANFSYHS